MDSLPSGYDSGDVGCTWYVLLAAGRQLLGRGDRHSRRGASSLGQLRAVVLVEFAGDEGVSF